jgi:hypothetical protein
MVPRRVVVVPLAALLAAALFACSNESPVTKGSRSKLVKVTGTVTRDGAPLPDAIINFLPASPEAERARTETGAGGSFEVVLMPGEYKVLISQIVSADGKGKPEKGRPSKNTLPPGYNRETETPFHCKVPPDGELRFDVKTKGPS